MTCEETGSVTWLGPGVLGTATPAAWNATVLYSDCSGSAIEAGKPHPVQMVLNGTETVQCEGPTTDHQGTGVLTWSDGTTSTVREEQINATMSGDSGEGEFAVTIDSGNYTGYKFVDKTTLTFSEGVCPGVAAGTFTGTLTMFPES